MKQSDLRSKFDLICSQCPLSECDEGSLWCLYRFATKPNAAQQRMMNRVNRGPYFKTYYAENRERKLKAANERNARKRNENIESA